MSKPVEEWLESFQCEEYAESFDSHGYKTLESLRLIDAEKLQALGIKPQHRNTIIQELSNLGVAMPCIDNLLSTLPPAGNVSVCSLVSVSHENITASNGVSMSKAQIPRYSGQLTTVPMLATTVPLVSRQSSSPPVNIDKGASQNSSMSRRIIVLPMRTQAGPGMLGPPGKASSSTRDSFLTASAPAANCDLPSARHGLFLNTSPIKEIKQPIARFIMDSSSSSSSSSSSASTDDEDSHEVNSKSTIVQSITNSKLSSQAAIPIFKSFPPDSVCDRVDSTKISALGNKKLEPGRTERQTKLTLNLDKDSNIFEVVSTLGEDVPKYLLNHTVVDGVSMVSRSLLTPQQVLVSTTALATSLPVVSPSCSSTFSMQGKQISVRESVSRSVGGFGKSPAECQRSPIKISPVNPNYSCVVTSSGGVSKIIFIPSVSVNSSKGVLESCSSIRSTASKFSIATLAQSDATVTTTNSVSIMNVKLSGKYTKNFESSSLNSTVDRKSDELKFLPGSALHSDVRVLPTDDEPCEQSSLRSLKLSSPLLSLSNNSSSGTRIVLLRKVDSKRTSSPSVERKAVASVLPSLAHAPVVNDLEPTLISDDSSDSDSVLVLDADTLLPTDKSPITKQCSSAKNKVILLNHKITPPKSVRSRRTPRDSKENGVGEELGRGKRKRKSKLLTRFLESGVGDGVEIVDKVTKPGNKNIHVRKRRSEVSSPSPCKKELRPNSVSPKACDSRIGVSKKSSPVSPRKHGDVKIMKDLSTRLSCQKVLSLESSSKKLPIKLRRVSKRHTQEDGLEPKQRSSESFPKSHSLPKTCIKNLHKAGSNLLRLPISCSSSISHSSGNKIINRSSILSESDKSTKSNKLSALSPLKTPLSEAICGSAMSLAQNSPPLNKSNKSIKMDVTNEDGVVESLVVEIVDITSSEEEEIVEKDVSPGSKNNFPVLSSEFAKTKLNDSSSKTANWNPLVSTEVQNNISCPEVPGASEKRLGKQHNSIIENNATSSEIFTSKHKFSGRKPRTRPVGTKRSSIDNNTDASSTPADPSETITRIRPGPYRQLLPRLVPELTPHRHEFQAEKLSLQEKSLLLAHHGSSSLAESSLSPEKSTKQSYVPSHTKWQNHLGFPSKENQRSTDEVQSQQTREHISPSKILSVDKSLEKDKKHNEPKVDQSGPKQQRNKRSGQKRRHRDVGAGAFGDDEDYTVHVKRLNRKYGGSHRRSRQLSVPSKVSRSESEVDPKTYTGPVVRVRGAKEHPVSCIVVAGECDIEEEATVKPRKKLGHSEHSRLSHNFQLDDSVPWLCVFCHRTSSYRVMGDLFGPYCFKAPENKVGLPGSQTAKDNSRLGVTKTPPIQQQSLLQRKSRVQKYGPAASNPSVESSHNSLNFSSIDTLPSEIWVHEECAVWTTGIYMLGNKLHGLEEAAIIALQAVCSECGTNGATLGCYVKGCCLKYHFLCAKDAGCALNDENFTIFCTKHKSKKMKMMSATVSPS